MTVLAQLAGRLAWYQSAESVVPTGVIVALMAKPNCHGHSRFQTFRTEGTVRPKPDEALTGG
jgi:hypothetical protein